MRLSERYKDCCESGGKGELADLYTYFGDVRGDDFMQWWTKGGQRPICGFLAVSEVYLPRAKPRGS